MVKLLVAFALTTTIAAVPDNWGAQDVWVHTSTWFAGHCTCLCQPLCSHPSENMRTNLVSSGLVPRYNNFSVPRCDEPINYFNLTAVAAVGQKELQDHFPVGFSRTLEDMWSTEVAEGNVPNFGYPCGGLYDESYLRSVVELTKKYKTPKLITDNIGKEVKVSDLRAAFKEEWGSDVVLQCLDGAFADVLSCWSKGTTIDAAGEVFPSKIVSCPTDIASFDECTNATTSILSYVIPTTPPPIPETPEPTPSKTKRPTLPPRPTKTPTSKVTTKSPAKSTTKAPSVSTTRAPLTTSVPVPSPTEDPKEVEIWVKFFQRNARCAVFGETGCTYCAKAKKLLESKNAKYDYFGVWQDNPEHIPSGRDVYYALVRLTKQDSLPNIWIGGKFIGGADDLHALNSTGKLDQLLKDAKCN